MMGTFYRTRTAISLSRQIHSPPGHPALLGSLVRRKRGLRQSLAPSALCLGQLASQSWLLPLYTTAKPLTTTIQLCGTAATRSGFNRQCYNRGICGGGSDARLDPSVFRFLAQIHHLRYNGLTFQWIGGQWAVCPPTRPQAVLAGTQPNQQ